MKAKRTGKVPIWICYRPQNPLKKVSGSLMAFSREIIHFFGHYCNTQAPVLGNWVTIAVGRVLRQYWCCGTFYVNSGVLAGQAVPGSYQFGLLFSLFLLVLASLVRCTVRSNEREKGRPSRVVWISLKEIRSVFLVADFWVGRRSSLWSNVRLGRLFCLTLNSHSKS